MAWITPNTDVYLLKSVPLDNEHKHTLYFENAEQQYNTFYSFLDRAFTAQTYQRVNKNRLRIEENAETIQGDNYLMFRNAAYGQKWFYAFIDKINYINDKVSEIEYTIDDLQTWYFDYDWEQCFVQREHTLSDNFGENVVDEGLSFGEIIAQYSDTHFTNNFMFGGFITNKKLSDRIYDTDIDAFVTPVLRASNSTMGGVSTTLYYYTGFYLSTSDYSDSTASLYEHQTITMFDHNSLTPIPLSTGAATLGQVINIIVNGSGDGSTSEDNIVYVFQYPAAFELKTAKSTAISRGFDSGCGVQTYSEPFIASFSFQGKTYTPFNRKLYTYPYRFIRISNQNGGSQDYKFENFPIVNGSYNLNFTQITTISGKPTAYIYPTEYSNTTYPFDYALYGASYPQPAYNGNSYQIYIQQNFNSDMISTISAMLSSGVSIGVGAYTQSPYLLGTGVASLASTAASLGGNMQKAADKQPSSFLNNGGDTISSAMHKTGFMIYTMSIKPEYAKIIDKYFSMYGYAVNEVKVPNIALPKNRLRPVWNYIKTTNAYVHGKTTGVPADALRNIEEIHNNGITYWMDSTRVGNYNFVNSPQE